jgi:predicted kinase
MTANDVKTVIAPRGIPASGKSTWVKNQVSLADGTRARINNDDLCTMLFGVPFVAHTPQTAKLLADSRAAMLRTLLAQDHIDTVYIDNTNLWTPGLKLLEKITHELGHIFLVEDQFLEVDTQTCVLRDEKRERPVGKEVIRKMARQVSKLSPWNYKDVPDIFPYENDESLPPCIIVDIDGTLANTHPDRDIYDDTKVWMDFPNRPVVDVVNKFFLHDSGVRIIVMSGRGDQCQPQTEEWLRKNVYFNELHMRKAGDFRPDWIVKHELFQEFVAGKYHVHLVLDDRDQVVNLWRRRLQLPTWQVADGNF